jgi:hypothetical protein
MAETKYGKYIVSEPLGTIATQPLLKDIERFEVNGPIWGKDLVVSHSAVHQPLRMLNEPHTHPYDEFVCFIGGNPLDPRDFGAEVEMCLGEEQEKHLITRSTVIYLPANFPHCPLDFVVVRKPVILMTITLGKEYAQKPLGKK